MLGNVLVDKALGSVKVAGDIFDVYFKITVFTNIMINFTDYDRHLFNWGVFEVSFNFFYGV